MRGTVLILNDGTSGREERNLPRPPALTQLSECCGGIRSENKLHTAAGYEGKRMLGTERARAKVRRRGSVAGVWGGAVVMSLAKSAMVAAAQAQAHNSFKDLCTAPGAKWMPTD